MGMVGRGREEGEAGRVNVPQAMLFLCVILGTVGSGAEQEHGVSVLGPWNLLPLPFWDHTNADN